MKNPIKLSSAAMALFLAGCNLDIDIEGQGRVYSADGRVDCSADCRYTNRGSPIAMSLYAEPADGFTFLGFMPAGYDTTYVSYGFVPIVLPVYGEPTRYFEAISTDVQAVFFATDQIAQWENSGGSNCVVDKQDHMTCWGEGAKWHPAGLDNVSQLTLNDRTFCAYFGNRISCWNDLHTFSTDVPASVINPISTINSAYSTCILYKPDASNAIYCMGLREPTPTFNNPTALWGEDEDTYCATDSSGTQCWGKYPPLPG